MNPLDQLRDIQLPPPPDGWPPAPGWWLLALAAIALILLARWWTRRRRRDHYRRAALAELDALRARGEVPVATLLALIRRTARAASPASPWLALPASDLLARLDAGVGGDLGRELATAGANLALLVDSQYRPGGGVDPRHGEILARHAAAWIRRHRRQSLC
ncbi:MAG: DUF4381 family protein [Porticoccaceae bacterium]